MKSLDMLDGLDYLESLAESLNVRAHSHKKGAPAPWRRW